MKYFVGLDAHGNTSTFVVIDKDGKEVLHRQIKTSEPELLNFVRGLKGSKSLVFEEMYLAKWLHSLLEPEVEELMVCNPSYINRRSGPKNDYLDAKHLAQSLRGGFLTKVHHENNGHSQFRSVMSGYNSLVRDIVRMKNRYKRLYGSKGIKTPGYEFNKDPKHLELLKSPNDHFVASTYFELLNSLTEKKKEYQRFIKQNAYSNQEIMALTTIPGISFIRANTIAATVATPHRFRSKYRFWSYCMLVSHDKNSDGRSYGKERKHGRSELKAVFLGAAESVIIHGKDTKLHQYYNLQVKKGLEPRTAKRALARKIAAIALAVMRTKKPYNEWEAFKDLKLSSAEA
jgi:transposase